MSEQGEQRAWNVVSILAACVLLTACAAGPRSTRQYAWTMDSVSNTCLKSPANCPPTVGQHVAAGSLVGAAAAGGLLVRPSRDLEENERAAIEKALAECADEARRSEELRGTLEPDLVIFEESPRRVQAVYDYKFPCKNTDQPSSCWRALRVRPARVQPHVGVIR